MDPTAERLILEHRAFAVGIAMNWLRKSGGSTWPWRDDIISAALEALVRSARRFDPALGVPFTAYAGRRIHGAVQDEWRYLCGWNRHFHQGPRFFALPDDDASESLDRDWDGPSGPIADDAPTPEDEAVSATFMGWLRQRVRDLPERQRLVMEAVVDERTLADIGGGLGVSESRACQLHGEGRKRMRVLLSWSLDRPRENRNGG